MARKFEVPAEKLSWRCDLSYLPFTCTAEMTPLEDFIGQDRAIRAIQFGYRAYWNRKNQHHQSLPQESNGGACSE